MHLFVVVFFLSARPRFFAALARSQSLHSSSPCLSTPPQSRRRAFGRNPEEIAAKISRHCSKAQQLLRRLRVDTGRSHAPIAYAYSTKPRPDGLLLLTCTYGLRLLDIDTLTDADCRLANW